MKLLGKCSHKEGRRDTDVPYQPGCAWYRKISKSVKPRDEAVSDLPFPAFYLLKSVALCGMPHYSETGSRPSPNMLAEVVTPEILR
jgi:hypothetical protein